MTRKALLLSLLLAAAAVHAQVVEVQGAWVRAAVPGQSGTGAFMSLTSNKATRLVGVSSPVAGVAEVHEMKMDGGVMRMRALPDGLPLPAGQRVDLQPGGYHLMLMDLKSPLAAGSKVPVTLRFKDDSGAASSQTIQLPVSSAAPTAHQH